MMYQLKMETEKTVHTALKKMEEINAMDIDEIGPEEIDMLKDCMEIVHKAGGLKEVHPLFSETQHAEK